MANEVLDGSSAGTSPAPATVADNTQEGTSELTSGSSGAPAVHTPPAADDELSQFQADVARATGQEKPTTDSKAETDNAAAETDEPDAQPAPAKETDVLSQDKDEKPGPDRPEWQALTKFADKLSPEAGKEARVLLRNFLSRENQLNQQIERLKPDSQVVAEMRQSVGGDEQGFNNMRLLIRQFDADPAAAVPMLERLLGDAKERSGMVLKSPDLVQQAQALDSQVREGSIEQPAADRRKKELLELEQARVGHRMSQDRLKAKERAEQSQSSQRATEAAVQELNQAESNWSAEKLKSDPDFRAVQSLHAIFSQQNALDFFNEKQRMPTVAEATQLLEKSLSEAKNEASKFRPKPKAVKPVTGGSNGSSGNNRQQPASDLEEFQQTVEEAVTRHRR